MKEALRDSIKAFGPGRIILSKEGEPGSSSRKVPEELVLESPHPNPFNPSTVIAFGLPNAGVVTVEVYNILGRKVQILAERRFQPGFHELRLDGSAFSSGVYFVRVYALNQVMVQKVTLLK